MKEEQKVSFIHSISAKIMLLTVLAVVMSVLIVAFRAEAGAKKVVGDVSADYILSMAEMGVEIVNNLPQEADAGAYENALADISMEGIDSSYAYLVDTDGTMLYHPTAEKIGQRPVSTAPARRAPSSASCSRWSSRASVRWPSLPSSTAGTITSCS